MNRRIGTERVLGAVSQNNDYNILLILYY